MSIARRSDIAHPGYVPGNWYCPWAGTTANGSTVANSIRLIPFVLPKSMRVSDLATRVTTVSAAGNFQIAIYANNNATGRPTGTALCSTASLSTASLAMVSGSVTAATLPAGTYWFASNCDNGVAGFQCLTNDSIAAEALIGSATLGNMFPATGTAPLALSTPQTFNTWPDITGATFTEFTAASYAIGLLKAA